ncbi:ANR family transcriptional regulator [Serratia marcescens]|uniref:ANR family transcriptional regulator n=1 Tax=Serratia marcescens TaxID=615 RepID=UPI00374F3E2F
MADGIMKESERMMRLDVGDFLPGVHTMSTPRARFRVAMRQAAMLERKGCFNEAASYWQEALTLAVSERGRHWCESRAHLCQKRSMQGE